jgi:hypothetical protein
MATDTDRHSWLIEVRQLYVVTKIDISPDFSVNILQNMT